ncbi:hypothetical protein VNI00_014483 [Paramarasmius palmivorus]|uniref:Uncharacterized protein n=1 Tax=Paramarasmius palmivorus TaxID=297713 RepID=A0AAW0BS44_9AGAR
MSVFPRKEGLGHNYEVYKAMDALCATYPHRVEDRILTHVDRVARKNSPYISYSTFYIPSHLLNFVLMEIDHYYTQRDDLFLQLKQQPTTQDTEMFTSNGHITASPFSNYQAPIVIDLDDYSDQKVSWEEVDEFLGTVDLTTPRPIAGSKRVMKATGAQIGMPQTRPEIEVFQSVSAMQGQWQKFAEELRTECYNQSKILTGGPPKSWNGFLNCSKQTVPPNPPFIMIPRSAVNLGSDVEMNDG